MANEVLRTENIAVNQPQPTSEEKITKKKENKIGKGGWSIASRWIIRIFLYFWLITILFPLYWMLATSLKDSREFMAGNLWNFSSTLFVVNFVDAFVEANVGAYIFNTLFVVCTTVVLFFVMSTTTSYILAKYNFKFIKFFRGFYFFSMMIPTILLIYQLFYQLNGLGLTDNLFVLSLVYAVQYIPGSVFLMTGFISAIDKSFMEAARIDGAGEFRIFLQVVMPFVIPIVLFECLTKFMGTWNEYLTALTLISSEAKLTLSAGIQRLITKFTYESNYGVIFASLMISLLPILVLYIMFQKVILNGTDMSEGIK